MTSSTVDPKLTRAQQLMFTDDALTAEIVDGRTITVPLSWYPRLAHATPAERANYRMLNDGEFIHWPDLDEDLRVQDFLDGKPSRESPGSFDMWLRAKQEGRPLEYYKLLEYERAREQRPRATSS